MCTRMEGNKERCGLGWKETRKDVDQDGRKQGKMWTKMEENKERCGLEWKETRKDVDQDGRKQGQMWTEWKETRIDLDQDGRKQVCDQRPNLKNLSRSLNLRRGSNMVGFTLNCIQCFKI